MNAEELQEVLLSSPPILVKTVKDVDLGLPKWSDLEKQYDPMKHAIMTDTVKYPPKTNETGGDDFKRTPLGLQKLAVKRISQSMFSTPVYRTYSYDTNSESQKRAAELLEEEYKVQNTINASNIERSKLLNASCQIATVWWVHEKEQMILGEPTKFALGHKTYSPKNGYALYPHFNQYDELVLIGIGYQGTDKKERLDVYTDAIYVRYVKGENDWEEEEGTRRPLEFMPVVYTSIEEPVWGGDDGTALVEQLEEMESYQGLYIKSNSLPTFALDMGEINGGVQIQGTEASTDKRRVILVGKGGKMQDVTWKGAGESIQQRYARLRNSFFEQIQMPDISFATLIASNTSAENKELVFADAKQKAIDLGGEWMKFFMQEIEIVKRFCATIFPSYKNDMMMLSVLSEIVPYNVKSEMDTAKYIALAGDNMSQSTKVRLLGEVNDVEQEIEAINEELQQQSNQGLL